MRLVKISETFFEKCKSHNTQDELLYNEEGRPAVLLVRLKYKNNYHKFVVPLRSNISSSTPKWQYFSLPPTSRTRLNCSHGVHYIKIFPVTNEYVESYIVNKPFDRLIKQILTNKEKDIIKACQAYLNRCEKGNKHRMTPDIDGILNWLYL